MESWKDKKLAKFKRVTKNMKQQNNPLKNLQTLSGQTFSLCGHHGNFPYKVNVDFSISPLHPKHIALIKICSASSQGRHAFETLTQDQFPRTSTQLLFKNLLKSYEKGEKKLDFPERI